MSFVSTRALADRCPGLLRPFLADDGAIVRLRAPGGRVATGVLADLVALAARYGAPLVQLTSRGNLQLRALPHPLPDELVAAVEATGLLPSASHERVRNILASPLAPQLQPLVAKLDAALRADSELALLPGRFLFAFADAGGDVLREPWDLAYQLHSPGIGRLLVGSADPHGIGCAPDAAVAALLDRAHRFLDTRPVGAWNVKDLPAGSPVLAGLTRVSLESAPPASPGAHGADAVAGIPLGLLRENHVHVLAALAPTVVLTPWRSLVVPGGAAHLDALAAAGLVTSPHAAWARVTACVGAPYCRNTSTPTLRIAADVVAALDARGVVPDRDLHIVGCERRCGAGRHAAVAVAPRDHTEALAAFPPDTEAAALPPAARGALGREEER